MTTWSPTIDRIEPASDPRAISDVSELLKRMVRAYGQATIAGILGVDKSTVSLWARGKRAVSPPMRTRIIEVHDVLNRVHQVYNPALAARWLVGHEPKLGGARPLDVVAIQGASPVIDALDAIESGAYS